MLRFPLAAVIFVLAGGSARAAEFTPKVVVIAMFEPGADKGDAPGEYQYWVEREHLDRVVPLPAAHHDVRLNADGSIAAIVTGEGNSNAAASIMALGCDPHFDFRHTYFLVAGIAGIDPADGSIGSAVWADYVVEGDLAHEIDAREIPSDWPTGYVPLGRTKPYEKPRLPTNDGTGQVYQLDTGFVRWAFGLTRDTRLVDNEKMARRRATYTETPNARKPPFVTIGANLASSTYWHGRLLNRWANDWVAYCTDGKANYVTTAMEDSGTLRSFTNLGRAGKVDARRILVLRTASNYDMQWPGATAAESLNAAEGMSGEQPGAYTAYLPSLEAAYLVGSRVVHELLSQWSRYETAVPQAP